MKRNIALLLTISLILSLLVFPVSAAEKPEVSLSVVSFTENKQYGAIEETTALTEYKAGDTLALKISFTNDGTEKYVTSYGFELVYDEATLQTYSFTDNKDNTIGPLVNELGGLDEKNFSTAGRAVVAGTKTDGVKWIANANEVFAYILFEVKQDVESGDIKFYIDKDFNNQVSYKLTSAEVDATKITDFDYEALVASAKVTGNPPTLNSVEITPTEGNAEATYGEEKTYTLKALSTSGKDITNLVETWSVAKKDGETEASVSTITFSEDKKTMTIGNTTDAGTYKITATYDGISPCGEITVNPAEISSMAFSLTAPVKNETPGQATSPTTGITVTETEWYKVVADQNDPVVLVEGEKFAPSTVYQAKISYDTDKNHIVPLTTEEKPNIDTTISGATVNNNNDRTVWCTFPETLAADPVTITVNDTITATYGQTLNQVSFDNFSATFNNTTVTGRFAWDNGDQLVGNVGTHEYTVVFTPNDAAYAVSRQTVSVTVNPASIAGAAITKIPTQEYTGNAITPEPEVKLGGKTLVRGTDYEVTYSTNINVGTATVTITGQNNFTGTQTVYFQITKSLANEDIKVELSSEELVYDGTAKAPSSIVVKDGNTELKEGTDYTVSYSNNTDAGLATVTVTGKGNYTGTTSTTFTINPQTVTNATVTIAEGTYTYNENEHKPDVTVTLGEKQFAGTDYDVSYSDNIDAGEATATVTFKGNYSGSATGTFKIDKATLQNVETEKNVNVRYGVTTAQTFSDWGLPTDVAFNAKIGDDDVADEKKILNGAILNGTTLSVTLNDTTPTNVGDTATIPVTFSSTNYNDVTITLTVTIVKKDDAGLNVLGTATQLTYGKEIGLDYSVTTPGKNGKLTAAVTGDGNVKVDIENKKLTATHVGDVRITFNYESDETIGTDSISFKVVPNEITVTANNATREYGDENPALSCEITSGRLALNDELNIEAETTATKESSVGTYPITLTEGEGGNPNYDITLNPGTLTITKAPLTITNAAVEGKTYDGTNTATVTGVTFEGLKNEQSLTLDTDYTVSGTFNNADAGEHKPVAVKVTLKETNLTKNYTLSNGTYTGEKGTITKRDTSVTVTVETSVTYTGSAFAKSNYKADSGNAKFEFYSDNKGQIGTKLDSAPVNAGTYWIKAIVEENDNENASSDQKQFVISPKELTADMVAAIPNQTYTGLQITPAVTVKYNGMTLKAGTDYTVVAYGNCTDAGEAKVHITGRGNYSGTIEKTFTIVPKPIKDAIVTIADTDLVYDKTAKTPTVTVGSGATLIPADNYTVAYSNNVSAGTATATVTFTGNYSGKATGTFTIAPKTVGLTWTGETFYYDGKSHEVTATVTTANGLIGEDTATVTVKGGKQTAIGSYIATAAKLDNTNYTLPTSGLTHNFTIKNAIESISVTSPATVSATVDGLTIKLVGTKSEDANLTLKINGTETTPANGKITVNEIEYTVDDSAVVKTPANVNLNETVPTVETKEDAKQEIKDAAAAISDGATKSEGLAAAAASAITEEAKSKNTDETQNTVTAATKLEIEVKDYEKTEGKSVLTLEITPTVTYTYTDKDGDTQEETKTISNSDIKAPVTISVKLPDGMPTDNLFVKHELKNGGVEYLKVTVDSDNVATWQQSSFSKVTFMSDERTVNISLVKSNGTVLNETIDRSWFNRTLPTDDSRTNFKGWNFGDGIGTISAITEDIFAKLVEKANNSTLTAKSVSGSSSEPDDKPSRPGSSSSSGPLLPSTGADELAFRDVSKYDYYYNAVKWAVNKGVTSGTGRYTFSPDDACTRAQTVTFLWRAAGCPKVSTKANPFTDVASSDYFYEAVLWAVENGITNGTSSTTFSPNASVTRAQVATFLWRANGEPAAKDSGFADVHANAYYAKAVAWAYAEGITTGTGFGVFSPDSVCTRAQIVTFLFRNAK